jgi:hypothetical protein
MEDHNTLTKNKPNSTSQRMEDLFDTQDYMAKHNLLSMKTQILKVWGLGNNIKACKPICELEREST